jgi:negative regulator of flagellin synthesis FlgM
MVESIGTKPVQTAGNVTRVTAPTPVSTVRAPVNTTPGDVAQAGALTQALAAAPPVDAARVARVRQAIADGTYPIVPGTIVDNLIALRLQLTGQGKR